MADPQASFLFLPPRHQAPKLVAQFKLVDGTFVIRQRVEGRKIYLYEARGTRAFIQPAIDQVARKQIR